MQQEMMVITSCNWSHYLLLESCMSALEITIIFGHVESVYMQADYFSSALLRSIPYRHGALLVAM